MYYYGYFRSSDISKDTDGQLYKVIIITDFNNNGYRTVAGEELELGGNPFIVEYSGADNNIFKPYKCSTATISFYQNNINKDFYSTSGNDVYIALLSKKDNVVFDRETETPYNDKDRYNVEWVGYATPNAYNQSFESDKDLFELEAQDALSTLQYFNFKATKEEVTVTTFYEIIKGIVATTGAYKDIYISNSIKVPTQDIKNVLSYIYVNEQNFFNEDGEPLKMLEVLEKILQYLGLTAVAKGNKLYILDYNAIASGYREYHHIRHIRDNMFIWVEKGYRSWEYWQEKGTALLEDNVEITKEDFSANGTNYSLSNVYNKVKVTDDFYFRDIVDVTDRSYYVKPSRYSKTGVLVQSSLYKLAVDKSDNNGTVITLIDPIGVKSNCANINFYGYKNNHRLSVNTYWYSQNISNGNFTYDELVSADVDKQYSYDRFTSNEVGACLANYIVDNSIERAIYINTYSRVNGQSLLYGGLSPNKFAATENTRQQRIIDFTLNNNVFESNDYICISGSLWFSPHPFPNVFNSEYEYFNITNIKASKELNYTWCKLECLGKYWNGENWQDVECCFKLPLDITDETLAYGNNIKIKTNKTIGKEDFYCIKAPETKKPTNITLTFMRPWGVDNHDVGLGTTLIKDFVYTIKKANVSLFDTEQNSNTEYANTILDSALEEFEDITLDITTYDSKDKDFSSTFCDDSFTEYNYGAGELDRLKYTHNIITGELITPEEHLISNICRQYQKPNICLELSLNGSYYPYSVFTYHFFKDSVFIVDSISTDYANNCSTLRLCEKLFPKVVSTYGKRSKKREYQRNGEIIINDSHIKKDNEVIEHKYNKYDVPVISPHASGNIYITQYPNSTGEMQPYLYTWFNVENNEIIAYTPNVAKPVTGEINNNGELIIKI